MISASLGLHIFGPHKHRGLEVNAMAKNRCGKHGYRMQEIRKGCSVARQGNATVGRLCYARVNGQEYADLIAGGWRAAEFGDSRTALDSADGIDQGSI